METEKLISLINEKEIMSIEALSEYYGLSEEAYSMIEELELEYTNPRKHYLGHKTYYHNKHDDRYFYIENYETAEEYGFYGCGEVKPVMKAITVWEHI